MKQALLILFIAIGLSAYSQADSVRGKQFQLKGKIASAPERTPLCGTIAWASVVNFEIVKIDGMTYGKKNIYIVVTCPEFYKNDFFQVGKTYNVVFSDSNQADFGWTIPNKELLKKNEFLFTPYVISIETVPEP